MATEHPMATRTASGVRLLSCGRKCGNMQYNKKICPAIVGMYYYVEGVKSPTEISRRTGLRVSSVWEILKRKYGATTTKGERRVLNRLRDQSIVDLRKQGMSTYEIGRVLGVSHQTVSSILIEKGMGVGKGRGNVKKVNAARHDAAIAKYGSKAAWKRHRNEKPWKHTYERWQHWCSKTGAEYDKTVTLPALLRRDGYECSSCGIECTKEDKRYGNVGPTYPTMDHIVPLSKGGSHTWDNVQVMCFSCNTAKKDKVVSA